MQVLEEKAPTGKERFQERRIGDVEQLQKHVDDAPKDRIEVLLQIARQRCDEPATRHAAQRQRSMTTTEANNTTTLPRSYRNSGNCAALCRIDR